MGKISKYVKSAVVSAAVVLPTFALAAESADVSAALTEAATKLGALMGGITAIGAIMIGITVAMQGYSVGKRMVKKV